MQAPQVGSSIFEHDQRIDFTIDVFDSPFSVLEGDAASDGLITDVREPKNDGTWTLRAAIQGASAAGGARDWCSSTTPTIPPLRCTAAIPSGR